MLERDQALEEIKDKTDEIRVAKQAQERGNDKSNQYQDDDLSDDQIINSKF